MDLQLFELDKCCISKCCCIAKRLPTLSYNFHSNPLTKSAVMCLTLSRTVDAPASFSFLA